MSPTESTVPAQQLFTLQTDPDSSSIVLLEAEARPTLSPENTILGVTVDTLVYILLGISAAAPILFLVTVAAGMHCYRRRARRRYSDYVDRSNIRKEILELERHRYLRQLEKDLAHYGDYQLQPQMHFDGHLGGHHGSHHGGHLGGHLVVVDRDRRGPHANLYDTFSDISLSHENPEVFFRGTPQRNGLGRKHPRMPLTGLPDRMRSSGRNGQDNGLSSQLSNASELLQQESFTLPIETIVNTSDSDVGDVSRSINTPSQGAKTLTSMDREQEAVLETFEQMLKQDNMSVSSGTTQAMVHVDSDTDPVTGISYTSHSRGWPDSAIHSRVNNVSVHDSDASQRSSSGHYENCDIRDVNRSYERGRVKPVRVREHYASSSVPNSLAHATQHNPSSVFVNKRRDQSNDTKAVTDSSSGRQLGTSNMGYTNDYLASNERTASGGQSKLEVTRL